MNVFINSKKVLSKFFFILLIILFVVLVTKSFAMQSYYNLDFQTGLVTATTLNVRSGPGINYRIVATAKYGDYIRVFAGIGNWYVVQIKDDTVGVVNKQYIKPIYPNNNSQKDNTSKQNSSSNIEINTDEQEVKELINKQRINNGLKALSFDNELQRVARIKAQDMVNNNYFSHNSPTYGSPFDMLNSFKISYKKAGENIAGNSSNSGAVEEWMKSPGHKANILNGSFNYTGIGVIKGSKYGKIFVQIFTEK